MKKILVAINQSGMSQEALKRAIVIAQEKNAQLYVVHIIESSLFAPVFMEPINEEVLRRNITEQIENLNKEFKVDFSLLIEIGSPSALIIKKAKKLQVDLLIIGVNDKSNISNAYFGSTALKLIQKTNIPVLVVKTKVNDKYKEILAPTNLTNYSKESILFATTFFNTTTSKCITSLELIYKLRSIDYKISIEKEQTYKKELLKNTKTKLDEFVKDIENCSIELINNNLSTNEDLLAYINKDNSHLLVLGSKGVYNLNSFIFGSTATYLLQRSLMDTLVYVPLTPEKLK